MFIFNLTKLKRTTTKYKSLIISKIQNMLYTTK